MIRCVLIDDDKYYTDELQRVIEEVSKSFEIEVVAVFNNATKAIVGIVNVDCDLILVDYEMPVHTGVDLVKLINKDVPIIFVTSHSELNQTIFNQVNNIVGVLNKPTESKDLIQIIKDKKLYLNDSPNKQSEGKLAIPLGKGTRSFFLDLEELYYIRTEKDLDFVIFNEDGKSFENKNEKKKIKGDRKYCRFYGKNDELIIRQKVSLAVIENSIKNKNIERVSKSHIVNMDKVFINDTNSIKLKDTEFFIDKSDSYKDSFMNKLKSFFN